MWSEIMGALGENVHIKGAANFLRLAEHAGWWKVFLARQYLAMSFRSCSVPISSYWN
jgi:hypothetical protein